MNVPETSRPRLVIIGGGFGGLQLAKSLRGKGFQIVLIDKHNYHTFQPLLYQVATAGLEPDSIAYPIRKVFGKREHFHFRNAAVTKVDAENKTVLTDKGSLRYDKLVVATGSRTNFFGLDSVQRNAMAMKSVPEALDLRSLILQNFEASLLTDDLHEQEALMNFVIVGGGPTGVELAGALAELRAHVLPRDYPDLNLRKMHIHLVEAAPRVLASMSEKSSVAALRFLEKFGVEVWLDTRVQDYDGHTVQHSGGKDLSAKTLIWAAGVEGATVDGLSERSLTRGNRLAVDRQNRVRGLEDVYAIGDVALMRTEKWADGHPMLAQVAMQQGELLAKNLVAEKNAKKVRDFEYKDKGSMATIGRNRAVVDLPNAHFHGFFAWFVWMFVHLMTLVGFRNKAVTFVNWSWSYVNFDRGVRLIIRPFKRKEGKRNNNHDREAA